MTPTRRERAARAPLTREKVLVAAVALADRSGLEGITMRKVGEALGVEAMSLYNHVANKSDLLDGMVDIVFAEIEVPVGVGWREALRARCASARRVLVTHPWAIALLDARPTPGPATLGHHDAVLGVLLGAGFSLPLAGHAFASLDSFTYGFALQETVLPVAGPDETAELASQILSGDAAEAYPHLTAFTTGYVTKAGYDFAREFDWGLHVVLDGIERARAAELPLDGEGRR